MLEKCTYTNHHGEIVEFGKNGLYLMESAIHDYVWTVLTENKRISSIERDLRPFDLPAKIICESENAGIIIRNRLHDVFEVDTVAKQPGKLAIGSYYISGYFAASTKTNYLAKKRMMGVTLSFQPADTAWHSERTIIINPPVEGATFLDFPFDYQYDFKSSNVLSQIVNTSPVPVDFRITLSGPVSDPVIHINNHRYEVDCELLTDENLVIDSAEKKIYKIDADGTITNLFHARYRASYIFEKIPPGTLDFLTSDPFPVELTFCEERSEPRWI